MERRHITITLEDQLECAHQLEDTPQLITKKCANLHGHSYHVKVEVLFENTIPNGMAVDFSVIKEVLRKYDHNYLNDLMELQPTAENFARQLSSEVFEACLEHNPTTQKVLIEMSETGKSWVSTYYPQAV